MTQKDLLDRWNKIYEEEDDIGDAVQALSIKTAENMVALLYSTPISGAKSPGFEAAIKLICSEYELTVPEGIYTEDD
jgi:hypothetical protein